MYSHNLLKYFVVLFGLYQLTSTATFRCYFTFTDFVEFPVDNPEGLVNASAPRTCLDVNKPTYIIAIGYKFLLDGPLLSALVPTLLSLGDRNVVLVNWVVEAGDAGLGDALGYVGHALPNSASVGKAVGKALVKLAALGLTNIYFIGHSLGAQLAGYSGRQAKLGGVNLTQIIALDPARLGYQPPTLYQSVDKNSASFVYVVHCDVGGYALNQSLGQVDFWPNLGNYIGASAPKLQPGCAKGTTMQETLTSGNRCSHDRCWQFYNISLTRPSLFEGGRAKNYFDWLSKNGTFNVTNFIGPLVDSQEPGDFYFVTGADSPWGLGSDGLKP